MLNKMFNKASAKHRWFILGAAIFGLVACSSTPTIDEMTVRMRDTDDVKITDMRSIMSRGLLTAQVNIKNEEKKPVHYRFKWLNKSGMQVGGDEGWKPLTIGKGQSGTVTGIAPHPSASDFKFELSTDQ